MPRVFIAIQTPAALQQTLADIQAAFANSSPWRWVQPSQLHITLAFLGEVPETALPGLHQPIGQAIRGHPPFTLTARALGCFPTPARPRVLWLGLHDPDHILSDLAQAVTAAVAEQGIPMEKRSFHPHITLARSRQPVRSRTFRRLLAAYETQSFLDVPVQSIHLFQSQLKPTGAVYTILKSYAL